MVLNGNIYVTLTNGRYRPIKNLRKGDKILGWGNHVNTVVQVTPYEIEPQPNQLFYLNDDSNFKITTNHPLMTNEGWKSIDPELTIRLYPYFDKDDIKRLQVGDIVFKVKKLNDGQFVYETVPINKITLCQLKNKKTFYNLSLIGNFSFYANNYVIHNAYNTTGTDEDIIPGVDNLSNGEKQQLKDCLESIQPQMNVLFGNYDTDLMLKKLE